MTKIAIVLTEGFADWEYALIGGTGGPFFGFDVQYFSPKIGQISSQGGLNVIISKNLDQLSAWQPNVIVIVGGTIWETVDAPDISDLLRVQYESGAHIGGICGGTLAVARSGLLDGGSHTSNNADFLKNNAVNYKGSAHYQVSASAVSSGRIITAPGTAPTSFASAVLAAAGLPKETVSQFSERMAAEHG